LFYMVGKIMAKLHLQTERIEIPDFITPKRWDKVFYYEGEKAVYRDEKNPEFISEKTMDVMDRIIPF